MMNNLINTNDKFDANEFSIVFEKIMSMKKTNVNFYKDNTQTIKTLIKHYYKDIKPDYNSIVSNFRGKYLDSDNAYSFKENYVEGESSVEKNNTKELKKGIELVYDYIQNFDFEKNDFNIFVNGLWIHSLLYKPLDDLRKDKSWSFGGRLRTDTAVMKNLNIEVPSAKESMIFFNSFLKPEKKEEYEKALNNPDIFEYVDYCVDTTADLIKYQPFGDGNKRTFRSLLNLMFKRRNIPPVYIKEQEQDEYKNCLIKAMRDGEYKDLREFYYYKICDSIYELDVIPFLEEEYKKGR